MISPRIELGTFCVLSRCHNQLDHETTCLSKSSACRDSYFELLPIFPHFSGCRRPFYKDKISHVFWMFANPSKHFKTIEALF